MSEPKAVAEEIQEVAPGLWHWHVEDDRIGGYLSAAHALAADGGMVLVDPLPAASTALAELGEVTAICLTSGGHQRSAWRYRRQFGAPVWGPALAETFEEEPDHRYGDGDALPGGLRAVFTPGAGTTQHTLLSGGHPGIAFVPDLLAKPLGEDLVLVPSEYMHDPAEARRSVERLLDLPFETLCLSHGVPVVENAKAAVRACL